MSALTLDSVVRTFALDRGQGDVRAVDGVSLEIAAGEVVGLLGHNGAGKTTLVRLLAGLLAPTSGAVRVAGLDPVVSGVRVRAMLGVLPTSSILDVRLTARQNVEFAGDVFGVPAEQMRARIPELLKEFDLADREHDRVEGFSAGMRQRLALARVLLPEPEILLLDEPSAALDPLAVRMVRDLIGRLARDAGRTVVVCTHDLAEAQLLCDRVVVLDHGRVAAVGSPADLAAGLAAGQLDIEVAHADLDTAVAALPALDLHALRNGPETVVLRSGRLAVGEVPAIVRSLVAAGVGVYGVRPYQPTLEDVYVALYDEGDA